ncbi:MAG: peptidoglycan-binding protein [Alphaproteobacteria bacterium]|nr:peptidoglycan-binding protein [Alphaproteobacteria bacterium]
MDVFQASRDRAVSGTDFAGLLAGAAAAGNATDAANVRWLQSALNRAGGAALVVDGIAGPATRAAIRAFQARNGLAVDGIAGPVTLALLHAVVDGPAVPPARPQSIACPGLPVRQVLDRFAFGRHRVEPHHQPQIDAIAACLLASLDTATPIDGLSLVGHTDPVGDDAANLALGQRRAEAVVDAIDASLRRQSAGRHFSFVFMPSSMGERALLPGDPALSRRVEVIAPFAFPPPSPPRPRPAPPFRSPLDPPRWGPILARAIGPRAVLRTGNAVRHLVDAENGRSAGLGAYPAMVEAIRAARGGDAFIYLLGWVCMDDFRMLTCDPRSRLQELLADAAARGVQVRAVFWAQTRLNPEEKDKTEASAARINRLPGAAAILDDETLSLGAHHQKVLVVGDGDRALVAFTGGIDVNRDRVLPSSIVCPPAPPPLVVETAGDAESMSGGGGQPLHDVHCRIEGPAAFDLLQTFITRWDHHPGSRAIEAVNPLRGRATLPPAPLPASLPPTASSTGSSCSVVIGRTFNPRRGSGLARERDIKAMLVAAIAHARRFIYMEDQYLLNLDAARALRAALPNIAHLTILIPASQIVGDTPCIWTYRREFIAELTGSLSPELAAKVRIFHLASPPVPTVAPPCSSGGPTFTPVLDAHCYVHAKCLMVDDELAVIGSANCNKRGWEHDSEVGAFVFDDRVPTDPAAVTFAQRLRMDLWAEHLDLPASSLADGIASAAAWLRPRPSARIVRYCPDDDHDIAEFKCGLIRDTIVDPPAP